MDFWTGAMKEPQAGTIEERENGNDSVESLSHLLSDFIVSQNFFPVASIWAGLFFRKRENSICLCHFVTRTLIKREKGQKQQTKK